MNRHFARPTLIQAAGNMPKDIEEFIGRVNSGTADMSIARMKSPSGWAEPGQTPDFDEYTLVLGGALIVETRDGTTELRPGEAYIAAKGSWVRYSSPGPEGAEYISVCIPAFAPDLVNRDAE